MTENKLSITNNVQIALANAGSHLGTMDVGAVTLLLRLSMLLDTCFDTGQTDGLPQLIARHTQLLNDLRLTPKSRSEAVVPSEEVDHGAKFAETYLRLVKTPDTKQSSPRKKSGTASSGTGRKPRATTNGVAKARPE